MDRVEPLLEAKELLVALALLAVALVGTVLVLVLKVVLLEVLLVLALRVVLEVLGEVPTVASSSIIQAAI